MQVSSFAQTIVSLSLSLPPSLSLPLSRSPLPQTRNWEYFASWVPGTTSTSSISVVPRLCCYFSFIEKTRNKRVGQTCRGLRSEEKQLWASRGRGARPDACVCGLPAGVRAQSEGALRPGGAVGEGGCAGRLAGVKGQASNSRPSDEE